MRVLSKNIDTAHPNDEFVSILEEHHEIKKFNVFKTIDSIIIDIYKKNKKPTHN